MPTRRSTLLFYVVALGWCLADQASKLLVMQRLPLGESYPVIPDYLALTHVTNTGGAWSVLAGNTVGLGLLSLAVCLGIMVHERRSLPRPSAQTIAWALVLGGAAGNMIDRFRLRHVVDMVDVQWHGQNVFPIFNVADIGINLGVVLLFLLSFLADAALSRRASEEASS